MISKPVVDLLRTDYTITSKLARYASKAAVFADVVPEGCNFPAITVRVMQISTLEAIKIFNVYIDYWDYSQTNASRETAKIVADRIEYILDGYVADTARYTDIRFRTLSGYCATMEEFNGIHYNVFCNARATRKKWMDTTVTTTTVAPTTTEAAPTTSTVIFPTTTVAVTTTVI